MRKAYLTLTLIFMILVLAACAGGSDSAEQSIEDRDEPVSVGSQAGAVARIRLVDDFPDALPISAQLTLGSINLDGTDHNIDEPLAANLLPLWQAYQALSNSDTTSAIELEALLNQIQDTMSTEQITAIADMKLTSENLTTMIEEGELSLRPGGSGVPGESSGQGNDFPGGGFSGGRPGGGIPGGGSGGGFPGGGPGGFDQLTEDEQATRIAERFGSNGNETDFLAQFSERALVNSIITTLRVRTGEIEEGEFQARGEQFSFLNDLIIETISDSTGVSIETVRNELAGGASFAEIIAAAGGDLEEVKAAISETSAQASLFQGQDIEEIIDNFLNRPGLPPTVDDE
jgi:hypothetical protein